MPACPVCGESKLGEKHPELGRLVCEECWFDAHLKPRLMRAVYWWRILLAPRVVHDAELYRRRF